MNFYRTVHKSLGSANWFVIYGSFRSDVRSGLYIIWRNKWFISFNHYFDHRKGNLGILMKELFCKIKKSMLGNLCQIQDRYANMFNKDFDLCGLWWPQLIVFQINSRGLKWQLNQQTREKLSSRKRQQYPKIAFSVKILTTTTFARHCAIHSAIFHLSFKSLRNLFFFFCQSLRRSLANLQR